jgi:hypothetical protein
MKRIRKLHLWLGTLFAPSIIFFAFTGMLQILGLHEGDEGAEAPGWIVKLAAVHKDQRWPGERRARPPAPVPPPMIAPPGAAPTDPPAATPAARLPGPAAPRPSRGNPPSQPLKFFFLLMSLGLIFTTGLGLYMSFVFDRNKPLLIGLLVTGTLLPVVLLFL